jgi:hypothetical protein
MRRIHLTAMAGAALVAVAAGSALTAQPRRAPATAPLHPLSERDLGDSREEGCSCRFLVGRTTLLRGINDEVTIRTRGGRQICRTTEEQFSVMGGEGEAVCAGVRLGLRPTGPVRARPGTDSAEWRAALTLSQGRMRRTLAGRWECAC